MQVKNRSCIRRLSFKTLMANRKRNLIAVFAIALTALLFTSLFTVTMSLNASYENYTFRQIGGYNHGTFKEVTTEQIQAISAHPKVKEVGLRRTIGIISSGVFSKVPAEVSFMDENCSKWSYTTPTTGRMPQSGMEIAMDTQALGLLGITPEIGAQVPLTFTVGDKSQMALERSDTFTLVGWWEPDDISPVHFINVSQEYTYLVEADGVAAGMEPFRQDLNVMMASALNIRGQMEQVDLDLGYTWETRDQPNSVRIGVNWGYTSSQLNGTLDAGSIVAIVAFLALVIFTGYLIIYNIFQISVTGDIRYYGLLKTIGVTPRQLRRIIRHQALMLCVLGIPLGMLLGFLVGAVLTPLVLARTTLDGGAVVSTSPVIFLLSAAFALVTVLLSCARPGRIAGRVSPVEATRYTEVVRSKKKSRSTRGAKVHQMALANLGRNKTKTTLVLVSLSLSVVLLNILILFTGGFDMEKYLGKQICADFIFSSTDYFRFRNGAEYLTEQDRAYVEANTQQTLSGCGYSFGGQVPIGWGPREVLEPQVRRFLGPEQAEEYLASRQSRGELLAFDAQVEGLDRELFDKLQLVEGDLAPLFDPDSHAIALVVDTDDYGNVDNSLVYPPVGSQQTLSYVQDFRLIDSRTGEVGDENTPMEFLQYQVVKSQDVEYTVCAYVVVPHSMGFRHSPAIGHEYVLPVEILERDSGKAPIPLFYLFDTPNPEAEAQAEALLAEYTAGDLSGLMYESKATVREEFRSFQQMFLLVGSLLCGIIGLVGILNFFNAIITGILSRRREFAVLQAVGMTGRQLKAMLVWEGLYYTLGASLLALALSTVLTPLTGRLLESMFWFFTSRVTLVPVLCTIPVFALLGWAIPTVAYRRIAKESVVERLRETDN